MDEFGGALLCDQVGMGKTFVALALGSAGLPVSVVAPAVLREMWIGAGSSAGRTVRFISTESLSRCDDGDDRCHLGLTEQRLLIVDEAHHFRNPGTRRYAALARLAAKRDVLLLSATPIHNKRRDLIALLSLFLGSRAEGLTGAELGRLVVRRETRALPSREGIPAIEPPQICEMEHDDEIPRLLLDLPPPLPPRDAGNGGVLVTHSLIRQWASSDAALHRALTRRLQRATSLIAALESGTYPSVSELSAWAAGDDCVQLTFAELVARPTNSANDLLAVVRRHADGISSLLHRIKGQSGRDSERANLIRSIRRNHDGVSIVAFSQYADTVNAMFRLLAGDGRVAALTGSGATVCGGRIKRADAIRRFAPKASGVPVPHPSESVTLLITTDLLSEGVNLQDAAVVVHLDLPWTPAKMEQRLGRIVRIGSRHQRAFSYMIRPPASVEALIRIERILRDKMAASGIVVDQFQSLLGCPDSRISVNDNAPRMAEQSRALLEGWLSVGPDSSPTLPLSAAVFAPFDGFLALCSIGGRYLLMARDAKGLTEDPSRVIEVMRSCEGKETAVETTSVANAAALIDRYVNGINAIGAGNYRRPLPAASRRRALHRIVAITSRARPHERARIASLGADARSSLLSRIGADGERILAVLSNEEPSDDKWMRSVAELGEVNANTSSRLTLVAVILLRNVGDMKP